MDQAALVTEEINAGTELVHEFDKFRPVKVAFWLKASDSEHRYLYIASDQIDDENRKAAYGEVLRLAQGIQSPFLDPFRVKVIGADHPLAKAAADVHRRFPARTVPTRFGGQSFGGMSVDDVFIYPPMLAAVP
jgi:hypothetical protein